MLFDDLSAHVFFSAWVLGLCVGTEDPSDLLADIRGALEAV